MRARAVLLTLVLVLAACGSRVTGQQAQGAGVQTGGSSASTGDGLSAPASDSSTGDASTAAGGDSSVTAGISSGGRGGSSGGRVAGGSSSGSAGSSSSGGGLTASSPGVSATDIKIGLIYDKSPGSGNAAFGFAGVGQADVRKDYETLIGDINDRGGVLGRKLTPVYATFDSGGADAASTPEVLEQRFCTTFTESRVFAAFYGGGPTFAKCMDKAGIPRVSGETGNAADDKTLAASPLLVVLNLNLDRAVRATVERLVPRGFYAKHKDGTPGYKLGLVRYDDPADQTGAAVMKQVLAEHGLKLTDEVAIKEPEGSDQIADETNAERAAALKFKSDGITHVQFLGDGRAYMELIFMQNAEKQLYRPRYGLTSYDGGQALATLLGSDAEAQLSGSQQVGWFPIFDVEAKSYSGTAASPAFQHCIELMQKAGESFTSGDPTRNKEAIVASECDEFTYFAAAASAAGTDLSPDTFMQGVARVDGLNSAATYIFSTSKRRDAYGGVKDADWVDSCTCFRYSSPTIYRV